MKQLIRRRANGIHQAKTKKEDKRHGQEKAIEPKLSLLRQIELDTGTFIPSTESTM